MKAPYRISLKFSNTVYYAYTSNGVIQQSSPYYLPAAPEGWNKVRVNWVRDLETHGMIRPITTPYQFVFEGEMILKHVFDTHGIHGVCYIYLEKLNYTTLQYEFYYEGKIDFIAYNSDRTKANVVSAAGGIYEQWQSNRDKTYEIPVTPNTGATNVYMDGVKLQTTYKWVTKMDSPLGTMANNRNFITMANYEESTSYFQNYITSIIQDLHFTANDLTKYCLKVQTIGINNAEIKLDFNVDVTAIAVNEDIKLAFSLVQVDFGNSSVASQTLFLSTNAVSNGNTVNFTGSISSTVNLLPGQLYKLQLGLTNNNSGTAQTCAYKVNSLDFSLSGITRLPATMVHGLRYYQLWQKIITQMTNGQYGGFSTFFMTPQTYGANQAAAVANYGLLPHQIVVTSAQALRQQADPVIKTTPSTVLKDMMSHFQLGMGIAGGLLKVEPIDEWYKPSVHIAYLGEVTKFKEYPLKEYHYNKLKIGNGPYTYDKLNGLYEWNDTNIFGFPINNAVREKDMVAPYRVDMFGIEWTRANLLGKNSTDAESDNDIFVIGINENYTNINTTLQGYNLHRPSGGIWGVPLHIAETGFNYMFTPKKDLLRKQREIKANCYRIQTGQSVRFHSAGKNQNLVTFFYNTWVLESSNQDIDAMTDAPFAPIVNEFEGVVNGNLSTLIAGNEYGYFSYKVPETGEILEGYIFDIEASPLEDEPIKFKLLKKI